ncbi:hypothetical protein PG990_014409 [Apiospora arundinis]
MGDYRDPTREPLPDRLQLITPFVSSKTASADDQPGDGSAGMSGVSQATSTPMGSECRLKVLYAGPWKCKCCISWVEEYPVDILQVSIEDREDYKAIAILALLRSATQRVGYDGHIAVPWVQRGGIAGVARLTREVKECIRVYHISGGVLFDDIIAGKGLGLLMLLAGDPGLGKNLTAEAVA